MFVNPAYARFTRWDCSDWSPFPAVAEAEDELASSILETLAANRGKTLYCGVDQSDTWTKRQVYDNAHRHNDRDRTQYDGSQGQGRFRGFTAGQEGWLTDGEHGITGVSPERIFEFPEVERKRRKRYRTFKPCPAYDVAQPQHSPYSPCVLQTGLHDTAGAANSDRATAADSAGGQWPNLAGRPEAVNTAEKYSAWREVSARQSDANAKARAVCRAAGARLTGRARIRVAPGTTQGAAYPYFSENLGSGGNYQFRVGIQIWFDVTCKKRR